MHPSLSVQDRESRGVHSRPAALAVTVLNRHWPWLLLLFVIGCFALLRWHLRNIPLERDEGEYAYGGQLVLHGIPPYVLLYSMKLPGMFLAYAGIMRLFGQSVAAIHFGLLVINAITTLLLFFLGKHLIGPGAGLVAGASYGLLTASPSVLGFAAHATHFAILPVLAGVLVLFSAARRQRLWLWFASGLFFGIAFLVKQPAVAFSLLGLICAARYAPEAPARRLRAFVAILGAYALGVALPFVVTCVVMLAFGIFENFWFWTFLYARQYATTLTLAEGLTTLGLIVPKVVLPCIGVWLVALVGLTVLVWSRPARRHRLFLLAFLACSALAVCPGLYFRAHYFVFVLPVISLLAAVGVNGTTEFLKQRMRASIWACLPALVYLAAFAAALYVQRVYLFRMSPLTAARTTYGSNPFPEALDIAAYLKRHTANDARIVVLGSEPEIYFYADRRSATGYIYTYGLMEPSPYAAQMQNCMIAEIEAAQPQYVVFVNVPTSFGRLPSSKRYIFQWMDSYLPAHYDLVGVEEVFGQYRDVDSSGSDNQQPRSNLFIKIFRRSSHFAALPATAQTLYSNGPINSTTDARPSTTDLWLATPSHCPALPRRPD